MPLVEQAELVDDVERRQDHVERRDREPSEPVGPGGEPVHVLGEPRPLVLVGHVGVGRGPTRPLGHHRRELRQDQAEQVARDRDDDHERNRSCPQRRDHDGGDSRHENRARESDDERAPPVRLPAQTTTFVVGCARICCHTISSHTNGVMYVQVNHADRSERNRKFRGTSSHSERDEPAQRVLGLRHGPEGALQLFAGQRREIAGSIRLSGSAPASTWAAWCSRRSRVIRANASRSAGDGVSLERPGGLGGVQAADRARDRDPGLERMEPGQVRDRDDPAALQVDAAVVTERQAAAEPRAAA